MMNAFNNCCNSCGCGGCRPARYSCGDIGIVPNPFDGSVWNITINGAMTKVKIPKINETDTKLSTNYTSSALIYNAERHTDIITGSQLGALIKVEDLRDTETANADSCDLLVYNPYCDECGDGCKPKDARWRNYHIPDAGDCELELDDEGYYHVLVKDDCGCIKECKLPVMADGSIQISYVRDSVPDDPDFPWYYGIYNDTINLHLRENASAFFGKYDLEVTVNYSIQVVHSTASPNTNFRSLLVPQTEGETDPNAKYFSSILQDQSTVHNGSAPYIPWGTVCLRGSLIFYVPKGKEASLHHEFRLITKDSAPIGDHYARNALDGQKVPDDVAGQIDRMLYTASRLNALQIVVKPARGTSNTDPVVDPERSQLDPAVDVYPNVG